MTGYTHRDLVTMALSTDEKWMIEKLNGENWSTWKFQMKHLLQAKELWGVVDGSEMLHADAEAAVHAEYRKKQQKAFSTYLSVVPCDVM